MRHDFAVAVETTSIWVFLFCYVICVIFMVPEVAFGATDVYTQWSVIASICLLATSVCWAVVQILWSLATRLTVNDKEPSEIVLKANPHLYTGC